MVGSLPGRGADPLDAWLLRVPPLLGYPARQIAFGNGIYVAVGSGYSQLITSADGINWQVQDPGQPHRLEGVTFGNGMFVVVGDGAILTSADGLTWTSPLATVEADLRGITFDEGLFCAVGGSATGGLAATSSNGADWQWHKLGPSFFHDVTFGNGLFVAVGDFGATAASLDGSAWEVGTAGGRDSMFALAFGEGRFVGAGFGYEGTNLIGVTFSSTNGVAWLRQPHETWVESVAYGNGRFVAGTAGGVFLVSEDGVGWATEACCGGPPLSALTYEQGRFIALGGEFRQAFEGVVLTSADGLTWECHSRSPAILRDFAYGNGRFVAVGGGSASQPFPGPPPTHYPGTILTSDDGTRWDTCSAAKPESTLNSVAFGKGVFVAVGETVMTSSDGLSWSDQHPLTNDLHQVVYGNGVFAAVGDHTAHTSTDGRVWTTSVVAGSLAALTTGNGRFLAVGNSIWRSMDGLAWDKVEVDFSLDLSRASLTGAAYGQGVYVIVGYDLLTVWGMPSKAGRILASHDGANWTNVGPASLPELRSVTFAQGTFVAAGVGVILTSTNGWDWTNRRSDADAAVNNIRFAEHSFFAVGDQGIILESGVLPEREDGPGLFTRRLPSQYSPSRPVQVVLETVPAANAQSYLIQEHVPVGWEFRSASDAGTFDVETGQVRFGPFHDHEARTLSYELAVPGAENGKGRFHGTAQVDGNTVEITGDSELSGPLPNLLTTWSAQHAGTSTNLTSITYGGGLFVAVGEGGTVIVSPDGQTWTPQPIATQSILTAVTYGAGQYLAAGTSSAWISPDAKVWNPSLGPDGLNGQTVSLLGLTYSRGAFVAAGATGAGGAVFTLVPGQSWQVAGSTPPLGGELACVAAGDQQIIAGGGRQWSSSYGAGTLLGSSGLTNWTLRESGTTGEIRGIAWGQGMFVAVGNTTKPDYRSFLLNSLDGTNWTRSIITPALFGITYGGELFVAVGTDGVISSSRDGTIFRGATNSDSRTLRAVAYGNGRFVAVGDQGAVVTSDRVVPQFTDIRKVLTQPAMLRLDSPAAAEIEASANLRDWLPVRTLTNNAAGLFPAETIDRASHRFYRARLVPVP